MEMEKKETWLQLLLASVKKVNLKKKTRKTTMGAV